MSAVNRAASALLGALLIDPEAVVVVREMVAPEDFPTDNGREVYAAILSLDDQGIHPDFVTVCCELERRGTAERIGTAPLVGLINRCPSSLHALDYAHFLAEDAKRRRLPEANGLPVGAMTW